MRVALKIAYDGTRFSGQQRQPDVRTVEGEMIRALREVRVIRDAKVARFQSASRTDAGVSALGNVVAFDAEMQGRDVARAFNAAAQDVVAWGHADVPDDFSARRAQSRWYRYLLDPEHDAEALGRAFAVFEGLHDFRHYTRDRERTSLRIDSIRVRPRWGFLAVDLKARRFAWNLVRRIVAAALKAETGEPSTAELRASLRSAARVDFGVAPAEPLILMDVRHPIRFAVATDRAMQGRTAAGALAAARTAAFRDALSRLASGRTIR